MSQELTEKVARAICKSRSCEGFMCCEWPAQMGRKHDCPVTRGGYDDAARAALAVVREEMAEPSEDMVLKGYNALMEWDARTGEDLGMMEIWEAMLSASPIGEQ